jgi:hypothetical protein
MSDKPPPPSREHFERFVARLLAVPKAKVDKMAAERRATDRQRRKTPPDSTDATGPAEGR